MTKYLFFKRDEIDGRLWYLMPQRGGNDGPSEYCLDIASAAQFTEAAWQSWGQWATGLERVELAADVAMKQSGAPMLPGLAGYLSDGE